MTDPAEYLPPAPTADGLPYIVPGLTIPVDLNPTPPGLRRSRVPGAPVPATSHVAIRSGEILPVLGVSTGERWLVGITGTIGLGAVVLAVLAWMTSRG